MPAVLAMLDRATEWLVARGRADQWGTAPQSADPRRVAQVTEYADGDGLWIAELDGQPAGALAVGAARPYAPPATAPELYVRLLVTDRPHAGRGVGGALLDHARALARQRGVEMLRVDCFAGGDGDLVRYYESQGFTRTETFTVDTPRGPWPGQLLVQRL